MKTTTFKRAIIAIAMMLVTAATSWAYDFKVNGIYYGKNGDGKTVYVTNKDTNYNSYSGSVVIPSTVTYSGTTYSVTKIGEKAFYNCSGLTSVTIGNSVTSIGYDAFYNCSGLKSVTIPNSVTSIGQSAFAYCRALTSVTIPNSVTTIGSSAFYNCSGLTKVEISDIAAWCKISFGNLYSNPLYYAHHLYLNGKEVTNLVIPNSVTSIGQSAFSGCSGLTSVTIPNSVTSIGSYAFYYCDDMTSVTIPNSVTSIGSDAFDCDNLEMVRLDATIKTAPDDAVFSSDKNLSFIVGGNVKSIPKNIVANGYISSRVAKVVALADTPPTATSETFDSYVTSKATLYVKKDSFSKYVLADGWGDFNNIQSISNPITNISIDKTSINLGVGETIQLKAKVLPTDATLTNVIWTSSNSCVSVDQKGNVIGQAVGQSVVAAEAIDGSGVKAECVVNVGNIYAQSISLSQKEVTMDINGFTKLSYTILPENVTIKDVEWSSSNTSVADFKVNTDKTIRVVGINNGTAYITARTTDGTNLTATCVFYVGDAGAETIDSDSVSVTAAGGAIRVEGAEGAEAEVYSLSGTLLYRGTDSTIALPRGIYIVKVAGTTTKVIL